MDKKLLISKFKEKSGILKTSELFNMKVSSRNIKKLISDGIIERIKIGYYRLIGDELESEAGIISRLFPDGVIGMYSALFYYEYSDRTPLFWDIYISKNAFSGRFKVDYPRIKPYFVLPEKLDYGVTTIIIDDCNLKIFDRDRLICECLKNESKMDKEIFNKAIQKYINDSKKNIGNLIDYCKKRKATKQMKSKIGVWL